MKRLLLILLAFAFPWLLMLIKDNPGGAVITLIMQASIIGWIPASMWALRYSPEEEEKHKKEDEGSS